MNPEQNPYAEPLAPIDDPTQSIESGPRNLEVVTGAVENLNQYHCLLTGRPARLVRVVLRRMIIVPPIWIGYKAEIVLPLSSNPILAPWQYVRMLRPLATFAFFFYVMHVITEQRNRWGSPLGNLPPRIFMIISFALPIICAIGLWMGLEWFLQRFEFVRLLYYNSVDGLVKIRFSKSSLAKRASEILVFPQPSGKSKTS